MITGLNVTIGVFVLVFVFSGYLFLEKYLQDRKAKNTITPKELAKKVKTGTVEVKLVSKMTPAERWDAHVENISK